MKNNIFKIWQSRGVSVLTILMGFLWTATAQFTISAPTLNQLNSTIVAVSWTTSVPAYGYVFVAEDDNSQGWPGEIEDPPPAKTSHTVNMNVRDGHTYYFVIDQNDASSNNVRSQEYSFVAGNITSVKSLSSQPNVFKLHQNYPNPFNPTTTIEFTLKENGFTTLKVYDMLGREVATLVNEELKAGVLHKATFNASRFSSGLYFYSLETRSTLQTTGGQAGKLQQVRKLLLMK